MQNVTITRPDGATCSAFYAEPANAAKAPGLVVIQEWWSVNEQSKGWAERYAAAGFRALVPDLYRGQKGLNAKEAEHRMTGLNFADAASQDIRGCVQQLETKLKEAKVTHTIHRYNATHAFANERPEDQSLPLKYDPTAAATAWDRSVEFRRRNLA